MNSKELFGDNLKYFRKQHKITQEELSEKLNITPQHLSRIENGKSFITAELLDALCKIFNLTPASFFFTTQEFSLVQNKPDDALDFITKIETTIDEELKQFGISLKAKIRS